MGVAAGAVAPDSGCQYLISALGLAITVIDATEIGKQIEKSQALG
jgi:hypothetical protein